VHDVGKLILQLTAYAPLTFAVSATLSVHYKLWWIIFLGMSIMLASIAIVALQAKSWANKGNSTVATVVDCADQRAQQVAFLATYSLPFLGLFTGNLAAIVGTATLFVFIVVIQMAAGSYIFNPILLGLGLSISEIRIVVAPVDSRELPETGECKAQSGNTNRGTKLWCIHPFSLEEGQTGRFIQLDNGLAFIDINNCPK
jgi:hypothetical protein